METAITYTGVMLVEFNPDKIMIDRAPTHPGALFLKEVIEPKGWTITETAGILGVSRKQLSELVNERCGLSPDMAMKIAAATDTSPESWYQMQSNLDLWRAKKKAKQCGI